jgi:hypothetical protein
MSEKGSKKAGRNLAKCQRYALAQQERHYNRLRRHLHYHPADEVALAAACEVQLASYAKLTEQPRRVPWKIKGRKLAAHARSPRYKWRLRKWGVPWDAVTTSYPNTPVTTDWDNSVTHDQLLDFANESFAHLGEV